MISSATKNSVSLDAYLARIAQEWVGTVFLLGAFLFLLLGIMDYFSAADYFSQFMTYRVGISLSLLVLYWLNRLRRSKSYQYLLVVCATILSAGTIELMVMSFGGHRSTYFAGLNLVVICALGFIPINVLLSTVLIALIYGIYVVPIIAMDNIVDPVFVGNNFFLLATSIIALAWRFQHQKILISEYLLREDLDHERQKLKQYSNRLEELVLERTKELNKSEQWHRSLFEYATDGILVLNRDGIIINANQKACELHGFSREAIVGTHIKLIEADENRQLMTERLRRLLAGESLFFEAAHNRKDGSRIHLEISSRAVTIGDELFIVSFYRDATEKKKIQEHLFQSQKLESIGVLAGGVAHDFNNILTAILGYTELIRRNTEGNEKVVRSLNIIESAARKSGRMISQLLDFSRKKAHESVPFSLNDVVRDTVKLLERVIDIKITLSEQLDDFLPPVQGDVNQMEQVIMNLIVNARDAMPSGGIISISTSAVEARRGSSDVPPYVPVGRYAVLRVTDTGSGIPPDVQGKIFEPFFTTKERGKGTGLGLSMVYGVVREHNGYITVQSSPGAGTTFTIYLPAVDRAVAPGPRKSAHALEGHETVLVVDDDESVLHFVKESLEIYGYHVLSANDPLRALETFRSGHRTIDLVITDIAMPYMSGKELIQEMRTIDPSARILEISGYGKMIDLSGENAPNGFVQKPFEAPSLASAVRHILDKERGSILNN